ncbi:hypothetical protein BST61_g6781 [Cercospora zeina]
MPPAPRALEPMIRLRPRPSTSSNATTEKDADNLFGAASPLPPVVETRKTRTLLSTSQEQDGSWVRGGRGHTPQQRHLQSTDTECQMTEKPQYEQAQALYPQVCWLWLWATPGDRHRAVLEGLRDPEEQDTAVQYCMDTAIPHPSALGWWWGWWWVVVLYTFFLFPAGICELFGQCKSSTHLALSTLLAAGICEPHGQCKSSPPFSFRRSGAYTDMSPLAAVSVPPARAMPSS